MSVFGYDNKAQKTNVSDSPYDKPKSLISCIKCSRNKILIESLTQQCWSLQKSLNNKDLQVNELKNERQSEKQREDQSFTEITGRILKEKDQRIKALQKQLQQLRSHNYMQKKQLQQKKYLLNVNEQKYKNSLLSLRKQMEELIQISDFKLQSLKKDYEQKNEENIFLMQKCAQLQGLLEKSYLYETKKINHYQQPHKNIEKIEHYMSQRQQQSNDYKPASKTLQKLLSNKYIGQNIKFTQNLQSTRSNKTLPSGDTCFKSERNLLKNNTYHAYQDQKRREMTFGINNITPVASQKMFKRQKCYTEDSLENILSKLGDIQRQVRKQIDSSKRGYK